MFEIDRQEFGAFVAELRKEKGLTQKELAQKLYISDKAISKWETGHSIPDVAVLVPLAELLGVSVTELLQCRRMEKTEQMDNTTTNELVRKVIELSEEEYLAKRKRNSLIYVICLFISMAIQICIYQLYQMGVLIHTDIISLFLTFLMSAIFGLYFWIFIKEKLPSYYDENQINIYIDGILHMNMPGVYYNNNNWPYIVKVLRGWSVVGMVFFPILYLPFSRVLSGFEPYSTLFLTLGFLLGGLFLPIYIVARKYQNIESTETIENATNFYHKEKNTKKNTIIILIFVAGILLFIAFVNSLGVGTFRSATSIAFLSKETKTYWSASYAYLNGTIRRNFWIEKENRNDIKINVKTEEGMLGIEIEDLDGNMIFSKEDVGTNIFEVPIKDEEKVVIRIKAEKHKGSFVVE